MTPKKQNHNELEDKMKKLKITNMVFSGKIPLKRKLKLNEINRLIQECNWLSVNEETSPVLQKRIIKEGISMQGKQKCICVSLWTTGSINIVGVINRKEAQRGYTTAFNDLNRICRGVLLE